ncbi:GGDEF domain-containing protein [Parasulfuritortus cantonensis]|nr:GGDEF domain-containing protein [Parasulfuritortus cantonensis]
MTDDAKQNFAALKAGGMLPSPRGVALAVLELTQRNDTDVKTLTHLVQTDPAMAGRLLRYANAAHGGSLRHIASLNHAIVFLGIFRVRQIALGFSLVDHYRSGACRQFDYMGYWTRSLATAIAAQQVAVQAQCPPDESFTCGLLSGIGRLALATVFPAEYGELLAAGLDAGALRAAETDRFGLDHATLSSELLEDWGLPEIFHQAVRYHEQPGDAPYPAGSRVQALTNALHFAAKVGMLLDLDAAQRWERLPSLYHAAAQLGLEDTEVPSLVDDVLTRWQEWGRELQLPARDFSDLKRLLMAPADLAGEHAAALPVLPMRLILVGFQADGCQAMLATLTGLGLQVDSVADPAAATGLLGERGADIVMVQLPDCGADAARRVRALCAVNGGRQTHCIAVIPAEAEAGVAALMLAGAADYLTVGHTEAALLARLNAAQRVVTLQSAVRTERETVIRSSAEWARSNRRLLQEALTDPLTRLYNRRYGLDRLRQEWSYASHSGAPLSCLMLDIDHFKTVNDRHGHDTGDVVLSQVAQLLQHNCRKDDVVFRFGGEEFCVVAPCTPIQEAIRLGERIAAAVRARRYGANPAHLVVTVSVGVACLAAGDRDAEALSARADQALYAAKKAGRDRVVALSRTPA